MSTGGVFCCFPMKQSVVICSFFLRCSIAHASRAIVCGKRFVTGTSEPRASRSAEERAETRKCDERIRAVVVKLHLSSPRAPIMSPNRQSLGGYSDLVQPMCAPSGPDSPFWPFRWAGKPPFCSPYPSILRNTVAGESDCCCTGKIERTPGNMPAEPIGS